MKSSVYIYSYLSSICASVMNSGLLALKDRVKVAPIIMFLLLVFTCIYKSKLSTQSASLSVRSDSTYVLLLILVTTRTPLFASVKVGLKALNHCY